MHLEVKARDVTITDVRDAHVLRRYLNEEERTISRPIKEMWEKQSKLVTVDMMEKAIRSGTLPSEWENGWTRMIREFVRDDVTLGWVRGISTAGDGIARKVNRIQRKQFDFDTTMMAVKAWIDNQGGVLIVELTKQQMKSIHAILQHQIALGVTSPYTLAQSIRPMVGLTEREARALARVISTLTEEGVPVARINKQIGKYAKVLHKNRSARIARTEISNAYNFGQMNSLKQARDAGWLIGDPVKNWIAGGANPCDKCSDNEAQGFIPLDAAFQSNDEHPTAHPSCECAVSYKIRR